MNSACLLWKRSVLPANGSAPNELKIVKLPPSLSNIETASSGIGIKACGSCDVLFLATASRLGTPFSVKAQKSVNCFRCVYVLSVHTFIL